MTAHGILLSPQQDAAIDFVENGTGSAILEAVAGAGKTFTLVKICERLKGSVAFAAYNKAIAVEIAARLEAAGVDTKRVRAATFHSLGFAAWRKVAPKVKVEDKKVERIMDEMKVPDEFRAFVKALVSLAKNRAMGVLARMDDLNEWRDIVDHFELEEKLAGDGDVDVDDGLRWGWKVLKRSIALDTEIIDFDDMIYAPLIHNAKMWQNDWVLVDEAQDTNPARRALARKMLKPGGRLIAVGDPYQAIYGFTGADNDALELIAKEFSCRRLPLTVTYRCPKAVVAHARTWVDHITAHDSSPEGAVTSMAFDDFAKLTPDAADAILCRNTKPLVEMAFSLIRRKIACHVEGREIGQGIVALARKWKSVKTIADLRDKLDEYVEREVEKMMAKGQEAKAGALVDKVDTLRVLMADLEEDATVDDLERVVNGIFRDTNGGLSRTVTLSTVHKAKGREWDRVFLLGRNRFMPSPYARQEWQMDQERNLMYVAVTRAKRELVEVVVPAPPK